MLSLRALVRGNTARAKFAAENILTSFSMFTLGFSHGLVIFLILMTLSETGLIWGFGAFSWECMGGMSRYFPCDMMYPDLGHGLLTFHILVPLDSETGQI